MRALNDIYNREDLKGKIAAYVRRGGGNTDDAKDMFHEGIIALERNVREGKFKGETSIEGYLYSICRFLWNNEWRKRKKTTGNEPRDFEMEADENTPEIIYRTQERSRILSELLDLLDEQCKKILSMWKLSYSMDEIAQELSLSSARIAKKYRYRCTKKMIKILEGKNHILEELRNV